MMDTLTQIFLVLFCGLIISYASIKVGWWLGGKAYDLWFSWRKK